MKETLPGKRAGEWRETGHLLGGTEEHARDQEDPALRGLSLLSTPAAPWQVPVTLPTQVVKEPGPLIHPAEESSPMGQGRQPRTFRGVGRQPPESASPLSRRGRSGESPSTDPENGAGLSNGTITERRLSGRGEMEGSAG